MKVTYKGTHYHGWQIQPNALSIQEAMERALYRILGSNLRLTAGGRTDTGVHATGQMVHVDLPDEIDVNDFHFRLNAVLPQDIAINSIMRVEDNAHARHSASYRSYRYHLHCLKDPFLEGQSWFRWRPLDSEMINRCCKILLQHENFQAFSRVRTDVKHFLCLIHYARWIENENGYLFEIRANRFLRGMVRALVGTLCEVGEGKISEHQFEHIILSGDRREAGIAAPAEGLFLTEIGYPSYIFIR